MKFIKLRSLAAILLIVSSVSWAAEKDAPISKGGSHAAVDIPRYDLRKLWDEMRLNNPQLIQMRKSYLAAKAIPPQVAAPNNPQIGFVWSNTKTPLSLGTANAGQYTLTQSFPFFGKKTIAADIADKQAESLNSQNDAAYLQMISQLTANYYAALAAQEQLQYLKEAVLRLELIKNIAKARYANNASAYVEYLNAQVAQSSAESDRFVAEKQLQVALASINTMIGKDPREKIKLDGEIKLQYVTAPTLLELESFAEGNHPLLKSSQFQLQAAQKSVTLAKMAYLPDFQIVATKFLAGGGPFAAQSTGNLYQFEFDVIIPLFFFTKEKYGVDQAIYTRAAAEAADLSVRQQVMLALQAAHAAYEQTISQLRFLNERQLPEAEAAYKLALNSYANTGAGFNDLLTAQLQYRSMQINLAQTQSNLMQAYAALMAAAGKESM